MIQRCTIYRLFFVFLLLQPWVPLQAQVSAERHVDISGDFDRWDDAMGEAQAYLEGKIYNEYKSDNLYQSMLKVQRAAQSLRAEEEGQLNRFKGLLKSLGPEPKADDLPPESVDVAAQRNRYQDAVAQHKENLALLELAETRSLRLQEDLSAFKREVALRERLFRFPQPWQPEVLLEAFEGAKSTIVTMATSPLTWFNSLSPLHQSNLLSWQPVIWLLGALAFGWLLRFGLLKRYGRNLEEAHPSIGRRMGAAVCEALARGVIPIFFTLTLIGWLYQRTPVTGPFHELLSTLLAVLPGFFLLLGVIHAVLAPDAPQWRLVSLPPQMSSAVGYSFLALMGLHALDFVIRESTESQTPSFNLQSVYITLATWIKGVVFYAVLQRVRALTSPEEEDDSDDDSKGLRWSEYLRRLLILLVAGAMLVCLPGYVRFGSFLIDRLIESLIAMMVIFGIHRLTHEIIGSLIRSGVLRRHLGLRIITLQRIRVWSVMVLDALLMVSAVAVTLLIWGVPAEDLQRWVGLLFGDLQLGSITFSLSQIAVALVVFFVAMMVTKLLQRLMLNRILPTMTPDLSLQHSLTSGLGYVGIVTAITLFIAALGINLQSIALVAGALSVGIGFGLQNIVSNFVSGVILIIERPIKVGDWVRVADQEGFVQQINFRATELETFTKASVIIPNSDMLSTAVVNVTYQDRQSRIEVPLNVGYDSDPDLVRELMLASAHDHKDVLSHPEPVVMLMDFTPEGLRFELRCFIGEAFGVVAVASDLRYAIHKAFREHNIVIPYPQRVVHMPSDATLNET